MKKYALLAAAIMFAASIIYFVGLWHINTNANEKVVFYPRFHKVDDKGNTIFNRGSLLWPLQEEAQKIVTKKIQFTCKIQYPIAHDFQCVDPTDSQAEAKVARKIADDISDTINAIEYRLQFDLDGQGIAVRDAVKPKTVALPKPTVDLILHGTSSPEDGRRGFEKSIQPDSIEKENVDLAKARLHRTDSLIMKNLEEMGVRVHSTSMGWYEFQLKNGEEVAAVMNDHALLDTMRFVNANVTVTVHRLVITPITAPVGLIVWTVLAAFLVPLLLRIRKIKPGKKEDWITFLWVLAVILAMCGFIWAWHHTGNNAKPEPLPSVPSWYVPPVETFFDWTFLLNFFAVLFLILAVILCIKLLTKIPWKKLWNAIVRFFQIIFWVIIAILFVIAIIVMVICEWWKERPFWVKVLLVHIFIIDLVIFITWLCNVWHPVFN